MTASSPSAPGPFPLGGAPVGALDALPPLGRLVVRSLRRWCDEGTDALAGDLAPTLGEAEGEAAALAFDGLCRLCLAGGRRPLMRHGAGCPCLGADEACLAEIVRAAVEEAREDALMLACLAVRPDLAPALVHLAGQAGLALARGLAARDRRASLH